MTTEKLRAIIALRVFPSWKKRMVEEAKQRGKTLSQYLYDLVEAGLEATAKTDVKQEIETKGVAVKQR